MRNFIKYFVFLVFVSNIFLYSVVFAQEDETCEACGSPPEGFVRYENFVKDVVSRIILVAPSGQDIGQGVFPGDFQAGVYKLSPVSQALIVKDSWLLVKSLNQASWTVVATVAIVGHTVTEIVKKDALGGFLILFRARPFVMAWKKIMDLDELVHVKTFDLGVAGGYNQKLNPENLNYIQEIFTKYTIGENRLFESAYLVDGVRYSDLIAILFSLNSSMKTLIASHGFIIKHFSSGYEGKNIGLEFDMGVIASIKEGYSCVKPFVCSDNLKMMKDSFEDISKKSGQGFKKSIDLIVESSKKLSNVFSATVKQIAKKDLSDAEKSALSKQADLLGKVYGIKANQILEGGFMGVNDLQSLPDKVSIAKQGGVEKIRNIVESSMIVPYSKGIYDGLKYFGDLKDEKIREIMENLSAENSAMDVSYLRKYAEIIYTNSQLSLNLSIPQTYMKEELTIGMLNILGKEPEANRKLVVTTSKTIMLYFPEIFERVRALKLAIGDKNSGLIKILGNACELQCSNKGGVCYPSN